jgi:hypothetical protein
MTTTSQATQSTAEQFLASQGIKFRVVQAKRGPGEWNVTFSRHGGGRLKLEFYYGERPALAFILGDMIKERPRTYDYEVDELKIYEWDCVEFAKVRDFFTAPELQYLISYAGGQG